ncbi:MAG: flagellar biosynthetic protein FliR [Pirellulales bacterium]|nr:flagellar biosynthetic protein FliR [Pirellulales bacterium]
MPFVWAFLSDQFILFTLILGRIGALIMTAPIFGDQSVPVRIRAFLAVALSILIMPMHFGSHVGAGGSLLNYAWILIGEVLIGLLLGLGIMILFSGIQVAGQLISQLSGLALADVFSPGFDASVPMVSQLLYFITMAVFVLIGGHRLIMGALLDTFTWAPPGFGMIEGSFVDALINILTQSFILGIRAAAPVTVALLLATLILGLIGRTMPQINILMVGFGVNTLLTLGGIFISLGAIAWTFQEHTELALEQLQEAIRGLSGS